MNITIQMDILSKLRAIFTGKHVSISIEREILSSGRFCVTYRLYVEDVIHETYSMDTYLFNKVNEIIAEHDKDANHRFNMIKRDFGKLYNKGEVYG